MNVNSIMNRFLPATPRNTQNIQTKSLNTVAAESAIPICAEAINMAISEQAVKLHNAAEEIEGAAKQNSILIHLRNGHKLNREEMSFLRENRADLYISANIVKNKIAGLEIAVRNAVSRRDAHRLLGQAKMMALAGARRSGADSTDVFIAAAIGRLANRVNSMQFRDDTT